MSGAHRSEPLRRGRKNGCGPFLGSSLSFWDPDGRFLDWCTQKGNSRKWERNEGKFECLYLETVKLWAADIHAAPEGDPNNSLAPSQQKLFDWLGEGAPESRGDGQGSTRRGSQPPGSPCCTRGTSQRNCA